MHTTCKRQESLHRELECKDGKEKSGVLPLRHKKASRSLVQDTINGTFDDHQCYKYDSPISENLFATSSGLSSLLDEIDLLSARSSYAARQAPTGTFGRREGVQRLMN